MSVLSEPIEAFILPCCICRELSYSGEFLKGHPLYDPWSYWACPTCLEWLFQIERYNYDINRGEKKIEN